MIIQLDIIGMTNVQKRIYVFMLKTAVEMVSTALKFYRNKTIAIYIKCFLLFSNAICGLKIKFLHARKRINQVSSTLNQVFNSFPLVSSWLLPNTLHQISKELDCIKIRKRGHAGRQTIRRSTHKKEISKEIIRAKIAEQEARLPVNEQKKSTTTHFIQSGFELQAGFQLAHIINSYFYLFVCLFYMQRMYRFLYRVRFTLFFHIHDAYQHVR